MRKTLIPLMLTLAAATPWALATANDDNSGHHRHRGEHRMEHLLKTVEPTDAQRTQIEAIEARYQPQLKSLHEQMRQLHEQMKTDVSAVLTEEQRAKLEKEEASHRGHRRHHKEG